MEVFISHSWRDKTTADILAHDIQPMCEHVWKDANQVTPGIRTQQSIAQLMAKLDLVLVIWTAQAADALNIQMALSESIQLGHHIVLCKFDDTPLPSTIPEHRHIDFSDYAGGFAQLQMFIFEQSATGSPAGSTSTVPGMTDRQRTINTLQNKSQPWTARMLEAGQNREKLQALLYNITVNEYQDKEVLWKLRCLLERNLNHIPMTHIPPLTAPYQDMAFQPTPAIFVQTLSQAQQEKKQLRQGMQVHVNAAILPEAVESVHYYILTSVDLLGLLHDIALNSESTSELTILMYLYRYLQTPHALLAEANYGAWGLIDDAWLIHNTTYRLIEAGLLAVELFPFDWTQITAADNIVVRCLPAALTQQLEALLMQFMNLIAMERKDYQPNFCPDANDYHPYIGQGQAVGIQLPQATYRSFIHC